MWSGCVSVKVTFEQKLEEEKERTYLGAVPQAGDTVSAKALGWQGAWCSRARGEHSGRGDWRGVCRCMRVCRQITQDLVGHNKGFFSNLLVNQEQWKGLT